MNAIDILKNDHLELINVMTALESASEKPTSDCDVLFQQFKDVFNKHDEAEDKIIYPALLEYAQLNRLIRKAYQAHHVVEVAILELRLIPYSSESWSPKFSVVRDSVLMHMNEEETIVFPQAQLLINEDQLKLLGQRILEQRSGTV